MISPSISLLRALRSTETVLAARRLPSQTPRHLPSHLPSHHHSQLSYIHQHRTLSTSTSSSPQTLPKTADRGPTSTETTQTDFGSMDVFSNAPAPTASIDACLTDGFHLDNGVKLTGGSGLLLISGEAFSWRPWLTTPRHRLLNNRGQWDTGDAAWGILSTVWPKPDLLILGLGPSMYPIAPETRKLINGLGIRVDVQDTRNAAAQFNLLATERGVGNVAAALVPIGRREPR